MAENTYTSPKLGLKVKLGNKRFAFKNGVLILSDEDDKLMQEFLATCAVSSRQLINKIDVNKAKKIAQEHAARMRQMGGAHQGAMSSSARGKQIQEVRELIAATDAATEGKDPAAAISGLRPPGEDDPSFIRTVVDQQAAAKTAEFKNIAGAVFPHKVQNPFAKK